MRARTGVDNVIRCVACGTRANRETAKFCQVCGKLMSEDYQPLDSIRSAHGLQRRTLEMQPRDTEEVSLFDVDKNTIADAARACLVYALVPYLGILFVPFAFFIGGAGYLAAVRRPQIGGRKVGIVCMALSVVVLSVQIMLWWLLYIIPEIGIGI